ncbi:MAG: hypothetical protein GY760_16290 [Deltaproteobacteria bacterium]|nr:hypothetical protein [Deltaproteobacteria bacterium]
MGFEKNKNLKKFDKKNELEPDMFLRHLLNKVVAEMHGNRTHPGRL